MLLKFTVTVNTFDSLSYRRITVQSINITLDNWGSSSSQEHTDVEYNKVWYGIKITYIHNMQMTVHVRTHTDEQRQAKDSCHTIIFPLSCHISTNNS